MTDELVETPLFPLNVVLVPGMALPLHIFEPRYRRMTCDCLDSEMRIGIVLAQPGSELGDEIPARVGTLARIVDYERLPDGRYNLLTVGTQRFEIVELRHDRPYLSAVVRLLPDVEPDAELEAEAPRAVTALAGEARAALEEYLRLVLALVGSGECDIGIPEDPTELSYIIVMCLACEDAEKQHLLEMTSVTERLEASIELLRQDIVELNEQAEHLAHRPPPDTRRTATN